MASATSSAARAAPASEPPGENIGNSDRWFEAMRQGDFARAFAISDVVLRTRDPRGADNPDLPYHLRWLWDGTPVDGRDVLVRCYHGLGDTLQFCRFLPALHARAASVHVEAQPALLPLLRTVAGVDRWIPFRKDRPVPPRAVSLEIMELAHALRLTPEKIPPPALNLPALHLAQMPALGLCWAAGGWNPSRSVPLTLLRDALAPLGMPRISLQRGAAASEADADFVNARDRSTDIVRTAALVAGCEAIVTVDTMVAHLAGTLGRPTLLLLKADADWRWMKGQSGSPWYPSQTLLRQDREGDWTAPLARLAQSLRAAQ